MKNEFKIKNARYVTSAVDRSNFLTDKPEFAFVGRSNVGKSSFINKLCNQNKLAKTSSTPGLTKMVNYFDVNGEFYFVDLPGYGFSRTGKRNQELWSTLIEDYLRSSKQLKLVFLLMDIRHVPTERDYLMQKFLFYNMLPYKIIATKCDKIAKSKIPTYIRSLANKLMVGEKDIIPFSVEGNEYKENVIKYIGELLNE